MTLPGFSVHPCPFPLGASRRGKDIRPPSSSSSSVIAILRVSCLFYPADPCTHPALWSLVINDQLFILHVLCPMPRLANNDETRARRNAARRQRYAARTPQEIQADRDQQNARRRARRAALQEDHLNQLREGEAARQRQRQHRAQELARRTNQQANFWSRIPDLRLPAYTVSWLEPCLHCGAILLDTESLTFCCSNGCLAVSPLSPYPNAITATVCGQK